MTLGLTPSPKFNSQGLKKSNEKQRKKKRKKIKKEWMSQEKVKFGNGNPPQDQEGF